MCCAAAPAWSMSLLEAYEKARANDATYRAANFANQAGQENRALGRANLLPQVSASANVYKNKVDLTAGGRLTHPEYSSKANSISLRQAIFNLEAYARYRQGMAQADASAANFDHEGQQLILRVIGAYIEALFSDEQVALARSERDTLVEQAKANKRLFEKGEGTRTDMLETQARLDLAEAKLLEALDNQRAARLTLAGVTGTDITTLDSLRPDFRVRQTDRADFDSWKREAVARNPELRTQALGVEIARAEVLRQRAGHAPRLDFVASYSKNDSETINTLNQKSTVRSVGVQLNVPLYSGGSVAAASRQAVANQERARAELDAKTNEVVVNLRKDYDIVSSSVSRIDALVKAVESAQLLMKATEQSIKGGVRINLDLLSAQEQLYKARRDLSQARFSYLLASLRLRAGAGALSADDVRDVAANFQ
jgi:protease secretion system outer membrane protein